MQMRFFLYQRDLLLKVGTFGMCHLVIHEAKHLAAVKLSFLAFTAVCWLLYSGLLLLELYVCVPL